VRPPHLPSSSPQLTRQVHRRTSQLCSLGRHHRLVRPAPPLLRSNTESVFTRSYSICPLILFYIRHLLKTENTRRDDLASSDGKDGGEWIEIIHGDGTKTLEKVDRSFLDLTDKENLDFRYCL
jgi:hypothetical protein